MVKGSYKTISNKEKKVTNSLDSGFPAMLINLLRSDLPSFSEGFGHCTEIYTSYISLASSTMLRLYSQDSVKGYLNRDFLGSCD